MRISRGPAGRRRRREAPTPPRSLCGVGHSLLEPLGGGLEQGLELAGPLGTQEAAHLLGRSKGQTLGDDNERLQRRVLLGPAGAWLYRVADLMRRRAVFEAGRKAATGEAEPRCLQVVQSIYGVLAWVHGKGAWRSADAGETWAPVSQAPEQELLRSLLNPRGLVVPRATAVAERELA